MRIPILVVWPSVGRGSHAAPAVQLYGMALARVDGVAFMLDQLAGLAKGRQRRQLIGDQQGAASETINSVDPAHCCGRQRAGSRRLHGGTRSASHHAHRQPVSVSRTCRRRRGNCGPVFGTSPRHRAPADQCLGRIRACWSTKRRRRSIFRVAATPCALCGPSKLAPSVLMAAYHLHRSVATARKNFDRVSDRCGMGRPMVTRCRRDRLRGHLVAEIDKEPDKFAT
jgi:hypothetical protein